MGKRKNQPLIIYVKGQPVELWLVPFFSDFGFKAVWVRCELFRRKAIEILAKLGEPISEVKLFRNEITPPTTEARSGIYDLICHEAGKQTFLIEMQRDHYALFKKRVQFYLFGQYCTLVPKEDKENLSFHNLPKLFSICIIKGKLLEGENYHHEILLKNQLGVAFDSDVQLHVYELGKFPIKKKEAGNVTTDLEKLLYTMKYAHTIQPEERPEFMQEDWLKVALRELDLSSLPAQQRFFLEMEMAKEADIRESQEIWEAQAKEAIAKAKEAEAQAKEAYEKGMEKGMEKGIEKGIEKGMEKGMETHTEKAVLMLHDDGFPNELIAKYAVSTPEAVERILAKYKRKSHSLHKNGNGSNGKTNGKS